MSVPSHRSQPSRRTFAATILTLALTAAIAGPLLLRQTPGHAAASLYPDLRALPPSELRLARETIDGAPHIVLRFTAVEVNVGQGPLELRGVNSTATGKTEVFQRIYDDAGKHADTLAGTFIFHPAHNHWHFEQFADYQLWTKADYDAWIASGRQVGEPLRRGSKTTGQGESVCVRDSELFQMLPGSPEKKRYTTCRRAYQGISVGYADSYQHYLPEQWIDLGETLPPDGEYVVRLVVDPQNLIHESDGKADPAREAPDANEATTSFHLTNSALEAVETLPFADPAAPGQP